MASNTQKIENSVLTRLTSNNYLKVSYPILKALKDPDLSVFLSFLISMDTYNRSKKQIDKDGFFLATRDFIDKSSGVTKKRQVNCSKKLSEMGLIEVALKGGMPARIWIKVNHQEIIEMIDKNEELIKKGIELDPLHIEGYS